MSAAGPLGPDQSRHPLDEDEGLPPMDLTYPPVATLPPPDEGLVLPHFEERLLAVLRDRHAAGAWTTVPALATPPGDPTALGAVAAGTSAGNGSPPVSPVDGAGVDSSATGGPAGRARETPDAVADAPAGGDADASGPGSGPRRSAVTGRGGRYRVLAAAAALVVLVGGGIVALRAGDADRPDVGTAPDAPAGRQGGPGGADARAPETRIRQALVEAIATSVVHTAYVGGGEQWVDATTRAQRVLTHDADGRPLVDMGRSVAPSPDDPRPQSGPDGAAEQVPSRFVDHCLGEYVDRPEPDGWAASPVDGLPEALASGVAVVDGTEVVDGRELVRVIGADPDADAVVEASRAHAGGQGQDVTVQETPPEAFYVDPATWLPVLRVAADGTRSAFEYLPRAAGGLAALVPPVPDGFARVDVPAPDEERFDAGCR